jgi:hypothetical protein
MDETITEDVRNAVRVGLTVFDADGSRVGYVDQVDKHHGWMLVRAGAADQKKLWIPYRIVKSVDEREIFVTALKAWLEADFDHPPARSTRVTTAEGRTVATTTEPSGYDGEPVMTSEVDLGHIRQLLAVDQQVWTSDDIAVGVIKNFDKQGRYFVVVEGRLSIKHSILVPVALVADVDRVAAEATLAVSKADLDGLKHHEPADSVIELQSPLDY